MPILLCICPYAILWYVEKINDPTTISSPHINLCTYGREVYIKHSRSNNLAHLVLCTRERNNFVRWLISKSLKTHLMSPKRHVSFGPSRILTLFLFARNTIFITFNHPQLSLRAFFLLFFWGLASVHTSEIYFKGHQIFLTSGRNN